jgi:hypothetical protein
VFIDFRTCAISDHGPAPTPTDEWPTIDWEIVKQRFGVCEMHHKCSVDVPDPASLPGFQVIECITHKIIPKPIGRDFAALSYVWGAETSTVTAPNVLAPAPPLIEDAMSCILAMGIQYLWVDRYCIDQTSPTKLTQIQNMDKIYMGATITTINAAGEGANCRLPGISPDSRRETLPSVATRGYMFQLQPHPEHEIATNKWSTRGWTYQEGYLARGRLAFTCTHIYFQCKRESYCIYAPLSGPHGCQLATLRSYERHMGITASSPLLTMVPPMLRL